MTRTGFEVVQIVSSEGKLNVAESNLLIKGLVVGYSDSSQVLVWGVTSTENRDCDNVVSGRARHTHHGDFDDEYGTVMEL